MLICVFVCLVGFVFGGGAKASKNAFTKLQSKLNITTSVSMSRSLSLSLVCFSSNPVLIEMFSFTLSF